MRESLLYANAVHVDLCTNVIHARDADSIGAAMGAVLKDVDEYASVFLCDGKCLCTWGRQILKAVLRDKRNDVVDDCAGFTNGGGSGLTGAVLVTGDSPVACLDCTGVTSVILLFVGLAFGVASASWRLFIAR